ncbi:Pycsar system effector family protein [Salinicoccus roseus]|uniref:Pycsar system effector family protein n=1 Tax=Salinicoccus roseus TaxID=45670 RepID=UPI002301081C|nr:Pycsar system effector family protein [Salinicoccus roseus]
MNNQEALEALLERINFWIGNVDAKVSFLLSLTTVILGLLLADSATKIFLEQYLTNFKDNWLSLEIIGFLVFLIVILSLIGAILCFLQALKGRINSKEYEQDDLVTNSLLHWGNIAGKKYTEFSSEFKERVDEEKILEDFTSQIYINSLIVNTKFKCYNTGILLLIIGGIAFIILKICLLFYR